MNLNDIENNNNCFSNFSTAFQPLRKEPNFPIQMTAYINYVFQGQSQDLFF
jgi:hypothetical protein